MAEFVMLDELDTYIARAVGKVNDGVNEARKLGVQAELPAKLDFDVIVIDRWQALESAVSENGTTKETGGTVETGTSKETTTGTDTGTTTEKQGGYQTETSTATTTDSTEGTENRDSAGENHHTQNTDETVTSK